MIIISAIGLFISIATFLFFLKDFPMNLVYSRQKSFVIFNIFGLMFSFIATFFFLSLFLASLIENNTNPKKRVLILKDNKKVVCSFVKEDNTFLYCKDNKTLKGFNKNEIKEIIFKKEN